MTFRCSICDYWGEPGLLQCGCESGPCPEGGPRPGCPGPTVGCPVCLNGSVDPWALLREIRMLAEVQTVSASGPSDSPAKREGAVATPSPDEDRRPRAAKMPFASEWDLLVVSISSIWSDLTRAELAATAGDRIGFEALLRRRYGYGAALAQQLTNGLLDLHERFNGRWDVLGESVPRFWPKISAAEVTRMNGTIGELAGLVERRYGLPAGEGRRAVTDFLGKVDYPLLVRLSRQEKTPSENPGQFAETRSTTGRKNAG